MRRLPRLIASGVLGGKPMAQFDDYVTSQANFRACFPLDETSGGYSRMVSPAVALGRNIATYCDFATDSGWTKGSGWTIADGKLVATAVANGVSVYRALPLVAGATYTISFTVSEYVQGTVRVYAGSGGAGTSRTADGTYTEDIVCSGVANLYIYSMGGATTLTAKIDNLTVQRKSIAASTSYAYTEMLVNGSMETPDTGWTAANDAVLTYETDHPQAGTRNLKVAYNGTNNPHALQAVLTVGKRYRITGYVRGDGTVVPRVTNGAAITLLIGAATAAWQAFDIRFTAVDTTIWLRAMATAAGFAEFDAISCIDIDPSAGIVTGAVPGAIAMGTKRLPGYTFTNDTLDIYSPTLNDLVDPELFTVAIWLKASNASAWWDVTARYIYHMRGVISTNYLSIIADGYGGIVVTLSRNGVLKGTRISVNTAALLCLHIVVDYANDDFRVMVNGSQHGVTRSVLGAWVNTDNVYDAGWVVGNWLNYAGTGWNGIIGPVAFFNEARSAANCLADAAAGGAVITWPGVSANSTANLVLCDGDSLTVGSGAGVTRSYPAQLCELLTNYEVWNSGLGSERADVLLATVTATVDPLYEAGRTKNIYVLCTGINDVMADEAAATIYNDIWSICDGRQAAGFEVIVCNLTPISSLSEPRNTVRLAVNAEIAANWAAHADAFVDFAGDARLANPADATYYVDGTHNTNAGYAVRAALVKAVIDTL